MSGPEDSRRAFLAGGTVVAASAAFVSDAAAQSKMVINDPSVVREIEAEFAGYDRALATTMLRRSTGSSSTVPQPSATGSPKISTAIRRFKPFEARSCPRVRGRSVSVP
jgi:hypothetical protein